MSARAPTERCERSMLQDFIDLFRFRARRRAAARFAPVCMPARWRWSYDARFEAYSDGIEWVGRPSAPPFAGEFWLVGDRLFHGWPDPPEFAFWALGGDGRLRCAAEFDWWPAAWTREERPGCDGIHGGGRR